MGGSTSLEAPAPPAMPAPIASEASAPQAPVAWRLAPLTTGQLDEVLALDAHVSADPWSASQFATELALEDRRYLVALADTGDAGPVVGFAGVALLHGGAHVMTIAVAPAQRGRGIGRALLDSLVAEADRVGLAVTLEVRASNLVARRLYGRAGFDEAGVRPKYYPDGEDAVLLWRR